MGFTKESWREGQEEEREWCRLSLDTSLEVEDIEAQTSIDQANPRVTQLLEDILMILDKPAEDIPDMDPASIETNDHYGWTIQTFTLHGRTIARVKFRDIVVDSDDFSKVEIGRMLQKKINSQSPKLKPAPPREVENYLVAQILLCRGGNVSP